MADITTLKDWRFSIDEQQIAWAIFDREGESQNALGRRPLEELMAIVERVEAGARDRSIAGLAILSGKEKGFIVGADVREFEQFTTAAEVTEAISPVLAMLGARRLRHSRILPRWRARISTRLPLSYRHPRRQYPRRVPRGSPRHLPRF